MGKYNFVSPGAMAGNAIEEFFIRQQAEQRQQMLDKLMQEKQAQEAARQQEQLALQRQQIEGTAADRTARTAQDEREFEFRKAGTIANSALPDDAVDPETAALLTRQGFGGQVRKVPGVVQQGPQIDTQDEVPIYDVTQTPDELRMRGGSQYLSQRAAEDARAAQAEQAQAAQAERAAADRASREEQGAANRDLRESIARMGAGNASETNDLKNQILQQRIDAENQKQTEKSASDKRAKDAAMVTSGATIDVLKQLADFDPSGKATLKPGTANLFGARIPGAGYIPGSDTATSQAALDRLKGRVIVDLLNEMKNQSRTGATGFGALSGPELTLLENAASQLNSPNISDERAAQELERIYNMAQRLYGEQPTSGGGVQKWGRDAQGRPVRLP